METPIEDQNRCLALLMLLAAGCSQQDTADTLHCAKTTVVKVENWFHQISISEAALFCNSTAMKYTFLLEIATSDQQLDHKKLIVVSQMDGAYLLKHFGKTKNTGQIPLLVPDRQQHYSRLAKAAEKLRLNIKDIKASKGKLVGNVTVGELQVSKNIEKTLRNVDRLDAACLLSHLKATCSEFNGIDDWESLTNRFLVVAKIPDVTMKKLKEASHGLALKGTCQICKSWSE
jgi:hypothetical protein